MGTVTQSYGAKLAQLAERGSLRSLAARQGADFSSNDYLALSDDPSLRRVLIEALERGVPFGAGGSRLLRGNHPEHEALEAQAAAFFGAERALFFGSGYTANLALFSLLPQQDDVVFYDALVHASCHEGMRAGRALCVKTTHNDAGAVDEAIRAWRERGGRGRPWIAVESLYSMDGDRAPLPELVAIAEHHDGVVVIDEAHATGVFGPDGRGLSAAYEGRENVVCLHTCGKALGVAGALVCAPASIVDFLINRSRPFIFATAPPPLTAVAVSGALRIVQHEPQRRERLHRLIDFANRELRERCDIQPSGSQILPVIIGGNARTMALASYLQERGYDVRGVRPPTVPEGTARLRLSLTLHVDEATTAQMVDVLAQGLRVHGE